MPPAYKLIFGPYFIKIVGLLTLYLQHQVTVKLNMLTPKSEILIFMTTKFYIFQQSTLH